MVAAAIHYPTRSRITQLDIITAEDWLRKSKAISNLANGENEQALISAVFQEPDGYFGVVDTVQAADFFCLMYGFIWKGFEDVVNAGHKIEILTVKNALDKYSACPLKGDDLLYHLTQIYAYAPDAHNIEAYAQEVRDAAVRMRTHFALETMQGMLQPNIPVEIMVDKFNELLFTATEQVNKADTSMRGMVQRYWDRIEAGRNGEKVRVVPTGIPQLDALIGGCAEDEVMVLAGADKQGKTTLLLSWVRQMLISGYRVLYFSLEMTQDEIIRILTTMHTGISKKDQKLNNLTDGEYALFVKTMGEIADWKLDVDDSLPNLTPTQLRRAIRKHLQQQPVDIVVIDGLWLMHSDKPALERPQAVSDITQQLNIIAKNEFHLPILITHQYRDGQSGERPYLAWLSESISVRRNAQMILGIHRPRHFDDAAEDETGIYVLADRNGQGAQGEYVPLFYDAKYATYRGATRANIDLSTL